MKNSRISILSRGFKKHQDKQLYLPSEFCYLNNSKSLFRKYSHLVTAFGNTQLGRDFLGIPNTKEKMGLLVPNGYHLLSGESKYQVEKLSIFYTRPVFSPKLSPALRYIDNLSSWIGGFEEAVKLLFWNTGLIKTQPDIAKAFHFTVTTVYPDPDPESTSCDGFADREDTNATFSSLVTGNGTTGGATGAFATIPWLNSGTTTDRYDRLRRGFFLFDTSSLPDGDNISAVTLSLYSESVSTGLGDLNISIVDSSPASNTDIASSDYQSGIGNTKQATDRLTSAFPTGGYENITLNSTGISNISKTGISKFGARFKADIDNSEAELSWANNVNEGPDIRTADEAGTSKDPKLAVTHDTTTSTSTSTTTTSTSTSTTTTSTSTSTTTTTSTSTTLTLPHHFEINSNIDYFKVDESSKKGLIDHGDN